MFLLSLYIVIYRDILVLAHYLEVFILLDISTSRYYLEVFILLDNIPLLYVYVIFIYLLLIKSNVMNISIYSFILYKRIE